VDEAKMDATQQDLSMDEQTTTETVIPDSMQPYINKAKQTVQPELEGEELDKFLRAHIKTFRDEWEELSEHARIAYVHMMTSQLLQRKAAAIQIGIGNEFKLPDPSDQTRMFASIEESQVKPSKRMPALLLPPNLQPISCQWA
jgi:acyl-CoA reductase-like NAD-dependent aldehyde dehydrogenase